MTEWQVPGLAIAVVLEDEPTLLKAYGHRDVEADLPVTADTQFALRSITKSFTAAGLGMLVDKGRLDWTKPVREYLPEFRLYDPIATDRDFAECLESLSAVVTMSSKLRRTRVCCHRISLQ